MIFGERTDVVIFQSQKLAKVINSGQWVFSYSQFFKLFTF